MSLDIRFTEVRRVLCPSCGQHVMNEEVDSENSGGRDWYDILEKFGYYVPYDQRTEENDWYGKDMELTREQTEELYRYIKKHPNLFYADAISSLIARAMMDGNSIVINADW